MADYYDAYNMYAQDAPTVNKMDEYWAPEFLATQFLPLPQPLVMDLPTWKGFMVFVHMNFTETLVVDEMAIDTKNSSVVSRLTIFFNDRITGQMVVSTTCIAFYNLKVGKGHKIQMTGLKLYFTNPALVMQLSQ
ncbi:MAG: hypothetical protein GY950_13065 [bacterium]|nr:hypothetical protein [bacterium]